MTNLTKHLCLLTLCGSLLVGCQDSYDCTEIKPDIQAAFDALVLSCSAASSPNSCIQRAKEAYCKPLAPDEPDVCLDDASHERSWSECDHPDHRMVVEGEYAICRCPRESDGY